MAEELEIRDNVVTGSLKCLTHVEIPAGVTEIGAEAFRDCECLEEVTLPSGLKHIGKHAFVGCSKLEKLNLPDTLEALDDNALQGTGVRELVFPASLRVLGSNVFWRTNMSRLVVLGELPEGMKTFSLSNLGVQYGKFVDLQADRIPMEKIARATQENILRDFLRRRKADSQIPEETRRNRLEFIRRKQKVLRRKPEYHDVLLEERLVGPKEIDDFLAEALEVNDPELTARLLEYQEKYIDREEKARLEEKQRKKELRALTRMEPTLTELKKMWPGRLLEDATWEIHGYGYKDAAEKVEELTVPASLKNLAVTAIASWAFSPLARGRRIVVQNFMNSLRHVRISEGIRDLQDNVFFACASLEWVQLPEGLEELPEGIFWNCCRLKAVELPSTLKRIRKNAFRNCSALERVALPEELEELGDEVFSGCSALKSIRLLRSLRSMGRQAFQFCSDLEEVEAEPGGHLEALGQAAFQGCESLERVGMLAGLTELPDDAFAGCGRLKEIVLPDSLVRIMDGAFPNSPSLCFVVSPGSYGAEWAMKHGRRYRLK